MTSIKEIMHLTWPIIVISVLIIASLRITYLVKNRESFLLYRELLSLFFLIYTLYLFQVVTFQDVLDIGEGSNFVPFTEIFRYPFGSRLFIQQVLGNLLLFVPYGFFASYYIKSENWVIPLGLVTFASLSIEITQSLIGHVFDVDDIILNVLGGMIGYVVYRLLMRFRNSIPSVIKREGVLNAIALGIVVLFIIFVYQLAVV